MGVTTHLPYRPAAALLSRRALENNLKVIRARIKSHPRIHHPSRTEIMAIVKADAYGHDLKQILPALEKNGIQRFAVASLNEGIEARALSKRANILILGGTPEWGRGAVELLKKHRLEVAANDVLALSHLLKERSLKIHLKLDTGMNRLGIKPDDWSTAVELIKKSGKKLEGLFTHYATSSDPIFLRQVMVFEEAVRWFWSEGCEAPFVHSENSGALFGNYQTPKGLLSHVGNLIRPGISMYGHTPRGLPPITKLSPVLELVSEIGLIKEADRGEGISYGHLYRAPRKHSYGVVPIGYADGLSKAYASSLRPQLRDSKGKVKGYLEICGAICMDMIMVRPVQGKMKTHDRVVVWGRFPNPVLKNRLVEAYELNLRIAKRIPRIWVD